MDRYRINWEGTQFVYHSLALVNREICLQLVDNGHDLYITPYEEDQFDPYSDKRFKIIADRVVPSDSLQPTVDVHIRHQWPPCLYPPKSGRWVVMQPWEFGHVPLEWVSTFTNRIDELWVPTQYVKNAFVHGGVSEGIIHIIPNGVNTENFNPNVRPMILDTKKKFKFLFVGGAIFRKGIDLLLKAYIEAFTPADDVCLVIKNFGSDTVYKNQTFAIIANKMSRRKDLPEILVIEETLPENYLPELYRACNVLVHPYRGEGFGLPILESMACGTPAIVTNGGACLDYCNNTNSILVNASFKEYRGVHVKGLKTVGGIWFHEVDLDDLKKHMRWAYNHSEKLRMIGAHSSKDAFSHWTWKHTAVKINERLRVICRRGKSKNGSAAEAYI